MFVFLSIVFALSRTNESLIFAISFVFIFIFADLLERRSHKKRFAIALSSLCLTVGIYLFLISYSADVVFELKTVLYLFLFYVTLILSASYRITRRNTFFGIRTSFTFTSDETWYVTHEIASKLLFFSLFFYLFILAVSDQIFVHLIFFVLNIVINTYASPWLAKQFLQR